MTKQWTERFGFPAIRGRVPLLTAVAIDSLGTGIFFPFAIVYFTRTLGLELTEAGVVVTFAMGLAIVVAPFFGSLIDRMGPRPVIIATFVIRAVVFALYPLVSSVWVAIGAIFLTTVTEKVFWAANRTFVPLVAPGEVARWYGLERAIRNAGYGIGGLVSAALSLRGTAGLHAIVLINAASFVLAAVALLTWRNTHARPVKSAAKSSATSTNGGKLVDVLRDRRFVCLTAANTLLVVAGLSISVLLPLYAVFSLGLDWLPGVIIALNSVVFVALQSVVVARVEHRRHARVLLGASLIWIACFLVFALARGTTAQVATALIVGAVIYTFAELLWAASADAFAVELSPEEFRGRYMSVYQISWGVGSAIAPGLLAALLDVGQLLPWAFLSVVCLVAAAVFLVLDRDTREGPDPAFDDAGRQAEAAA
jgi:MFS family permease